MARETKNETMPWRGRPSRRRWLVGISIGAMSIGLGVGFTRLLDAPEGGVIAAFSAGLLALALHRLAGPRSGRV